MTNDQKQNPEETNIVPFEPPRPTDGERDDDAWMAAGEGGNVGQAPAGNGALIVDLGAYEGPLDILLALARNQKVDLTKISILALAEQYLSFINEARRLRLEIAADYLVMAAWLAYLKSRLLLPEEADDDEPSGEELAARLAFQLQRLEAMRGVAARLMGRHRLGRDVFQRGDPEGVRVVRKAEYVLSYYELLKAYTEQRLRQLAVSPMHIRRLPVLALEDARKRLERLVGHVPEWTELATFLPPEWQGGGATRSAIASTFAASLELVREGYVELKQTETFGPLFVRGRIRSPETTES